MAQRLLFSKAQRDNSGVSVLLARVVLFSFLLASVGCLNPEIHNASLGKKSLPENSDESTGESSDDNDGEGGPGADPGTEILATKLRVRFPTISNLEANYGVCLPLEILLVNDDGEESFLLMPFLVELEAVHKVTFQDASAGAYFSDSGCQNSWDGQAQFEEGVSVFKAFYKTNLKGLINFAAKSPLLENGTKILKVQFTGSKLYSLDPPSLSGLNASGEYELQAQKCIGPWKVKLSDDVGNALEAESKKIWVLGNNPNFKSLLYTSSDCTTGETNAIEMEVGESATSDYYIKLIGSGLSKVTIQEPGSNGYKLKSFPIAPRLVLVPQDPISSVSEHVAGECVKFQVKTEYSDGSPWTMQLTSYLQLENFEEDVFYNSNCNGTQKDDKIKFVESSSVTNFWVRRNQVGMTTLDLENPASPSHMLLREAGELDHFEFKESFSNVIKNTCVRVDILLKDQFGNYANAPSSDWKLKFKSSAHQFKLYSDGECSSAIGAADPGEFLYAKPSFGASSVSVFFRKNLSGTHEFQFKGTPELNGAWKSVSIQQVDSGEPVSYSLTLAGGNDNSLDIAQNTCIALELRLYNDVGQLFSGGHSGALFDIIPYKTGGDEYEGLKIYSDDDCEDLTLNKEIWVSGFQNKKTLSVKFNQVYFLPPIPDAYVRADSPQISPSYLGTQVHIHATKFIGYAPIVWRHEEVDCQGDPEGLYGNFYSTLTQPETLLDFGNPNKFVYLNMGDFMIWNNDYNLKGVGENGMHKNAFYKLADLVGDIHPETVKGSFSTSVGKFPEKTLTTEEFQGRVATHVRQVLLSKGYNGVITYLNLADIDPISVDSYEGDGDCTPAHADFNKHNEDFESGWFLFQYVAAEIPCVGSQCE